MSIVDLSTATRPELAARGVRVASYDRTALEPRIVHIGVGGFHRSHLAFYLHLLAEEQGSTWAIHGLGVLPSDGAMAEALGAQHGRYTLISRDDDHADVELIESIVDFTWSCPDAGPAAALDVLADPRVAIVSLTVTESGYVEGGAAFELLARALVTRRRNGRSPVTVLSCDNLPGNGEATRRCTLAAAAALDPETASWIERECTFPSSMVDRITPATTPVDREWLATAHQVHDRWPVVAEPFVQWVLEDDFAAGRPPFELLEHHGVLFSNDIDRWEQYKLRLLNASHSSMAYLATLAGFTYVHDAVRNPAMRSYLDRFTQTEAAPSLEPIPGHAAVDYATIALDRFGNGAIADTLARLCIDGTAKFPKFLIPTLGHHVATGGSIDGALLALAGWAPYLVTIPHDQQSFDASIDEARRAAAAAVGEPARFLDFAAVFPQEIRDDMRTRERFTAAYQAATASPLGAVAAYGGLAG